MQARTPIRATALSPGIRGGQAPARRRIDPVRPDYAVTVTTASAHLQ